MIIITDDRCLNYHSPGHPERPQRISQTTARLRSQSDISIELLQPNPASDAQLLRAHSVEHLNSLERPEDFDADTPAHPQILEHGRMAAGGAIQAMEAARKGHQVFSLMRPPGHHASTNRAMGFCYLNSIAIAALEAVSTGAEKVGIFDFDVHHGNGTEEILLSKAGCAYFSVHQYPAYPGTGAGHVRNCYNYPVPPQSPRRSYRLAFRSALDDLRRFEPSLVGVSAGFDAYRSDPLGEELLEQEDYYWLGRSIRELGIPNFSILEGGYSEDLPELVLAFLRGLVC